MACCNFIFIEEKIAWRNDAPVGASRGRAFSSGRLQAATLGCVSTYASTYKTSLHEQNASRIKWHQTNQLHSRNRPESPAQLSAMRRQCGRLETTKLLSVHSEGEDVKEDTSGWNARTCRIIHFHTLARSIHPCCTFGKKKVAY